MRYKIVMSILTAGLFCPWAMAQDAAPEAPVTIAPAPLAPLALDARYEVDWTGIPIGRVNITASEDGTNYHMAVDTSTSGIAQLFSDEKRVAEVTGHGGMATPYLASRYESKPLQGGKGQYTLITYDADGHIAEQQRIPGDAAYWRPPVPLEQANAAHDSITAGFVLRQLLYADIAHHTHDAHIHTYDGARLAEMTLTVVNDHAQLEVMGKTLEVVDTVVTRQPIIGYTPKELKKFAAGDPEIHLYFTHDAAFLPVKVTVDSSFGQISGTMVRNH